MRQPLFRDRVGNASILSALGIVAVSAAGALAVDISVGRIAQVEIKNAAEAGAHAGTRMLDGTPEGIEAAKQMAAAVAARNSVIGSPLSVSADGGPDGLVEVGHWSGGSFVADEDPATATAVRVRATRPDIRTFLRRVSQPDATLSTQARSSSAGGGLGVSDCPLPIAIPSCSIDRATMCDMNISFGPDNNDNGGWGELGSSRPSAASIRDAIDACSMATDVTNVVTLNNGEVASAAHTLASAVAASTDQWDPAWGIQPLRSSQSGLGSAQYGKVLHGNIIVFDDPSNCTATKYNGTSLDIVGFMQVAVYDVDTKGKAETRHVRWHSYCEMTRQRGGGGWYGARVFPTMTE